MHLEAEKEKIRSLALASGFHLCGFGRASINAKEKKELDEWISGGYFGKMSWFPTKQHIRTHFLDLGLQPVSVISLGILYCPEDYDSVFTRFGFGFSRYATGKDYHTVIKKRLQPLLDFLQEKYPRYRFRPATDTLPIAEKVLAVQAGIGWQGKNTNLLNETYGSWFFLAEILTDMTIPPDPIATDRCGSCTKCIDSCPTGALFAPYRMDARKCISYATIEDRSEKATVSMHGWIYGCDICQSVCPWNQKAERNGRYATAEEFQISSFFQLMTENEITGLSEKSFHDLFANSAVKRINYQQFQRNVENYHQYRTKQSSGLVQNP